MFKRHYNESETLGQSWRKWLLNRWKTFFLKYMKNFHNIVMKWVTQYKWAEDLNRHLTKKQVPIIDNHMEKFLTSYSLGKYKLK